MHPYSTAHNHSTNVAVYGFIGVLSVFSAYSLGQIIALSKADLWFVDLPSVLGFYSLYWYLTDNFAWRWQLLQVIFKMPNISGRYALTIEPIGNPQFSHVEAKATIKQTWKSISIYFETDTSRSQSISAALCQEANDDWVLTYTYQNKPTGAADAGMHTHDGTAELRFSSHGEMKEGEYYTGRDRQSYGVIKLSSRTKLIKQ